MDRLRSRRGPGTGVDGDAPVRMSYGKVLAILALTGFYLLLVYMLPMKLRLVFLAMLLFPLLLLVKLRPEPWLLAVPFLILLGGAKFSVGQFFPAVLTVAVFLFFVLYLADRLLWNRPMVRPWLPVKLTVAALAVQVVTIFISIHVQGQYTWNAIREGSSVFLFMPLIYIVPDLCRSREKVKRVTRSLLLALLAASLLGVFEYFTTQGFSRVDLGLGYVYRGRVASFLGNPNVFAGFLELTIPLALAIALSEKSLPWKLVSFAGVILGIMSVLFTFSRGGLASMLLGCAIVLVYWYRRRIWIPITIGLLFVGVMVRYSSVFERQLSFFSNPSELVHQPTLLHRYVTYKGLVTQIERSPVIGVGWGSRSYFWGGTKIYSFWEVRHTVSSQMIRNFGGLNNLILTHLVRAGIIGLTALLLIFSAVVAASVKLLRKCPSPWGIGISAGMAGFFLHQTMDNFLHWEQTNCLFWFILGLAGAAWSVFGERKDKTSA